MGPYELLGNTVLILERLQIPYLVTGSIASMAYGEPRLTNDIDIVADVEEKHISALLEAFPPNDYYIREDMIREAIRRKSQFNIIHPASGLKIDVIIKVDNPLNTSRFTRSKKIYPSETYQANFAAPEDVIIKKMEYYKEGGSEKRLRDITGILKISRDDIDYSYISEWAERLGLTEIWKAINDRIKRVTFHENDF